MLTFTLAYKKLKYNGKRSILPFAVGVVLNLSIIYFILTVGEGKGRIYAPTHLTNGVMSLGTTSDKKMILFASYPHINTKLSPEETITLQTVSVVSHKKKEKQQMRRSKTSTLPFLLSQGE